MKFCNWKPKTIVEALARAQGMIQAEELHKTAQIEQLNHSRREGNWKDKSESSQ